MRSVLEGEGEEEGITGFMPIKVTWMNTSAEREKSEALQLPTKREGRGRGERIKGVNKGKE